MICHFCSSCNRYRSYPRVVCSSRHDEKTFDIDLPEYKINELNEDLKHKELATAYFDKLKKEIGI